MADVNRRIPRWHFGLVTLFHRGEVVFGEECRRAEVVLVAPPELDDPADSIAAHGHLGDSRELQGERIWPDFPFSTISVAVFQDHQ